MNGIILNKDVIHPQMRRRIEKPRIILLDCTLEYKKGESQTQIEVTKESDWSRILEIEEEQIKILCEHIIKLKPDLVFTEKGVSGTFSSLLLVCRFRLNNGGQTWRNTTLSRTTLHACVGCERRTTIVLLVSRVPRLSTEWKTYSPNMWVRDVASFTWTRLVMSSRLLLFSFLNKRCS